MSYNISDDTILWIH